MNGYDVVHNTNIDLIFSRKPRAFSVTISRGWIQGIERLLCFWLGRLFVWEILGEPQNGCWLVNRFVSETVLMVLQLQLVRRLW